MFIFFVMKGAKEWITLSKPKWRSVQYHFMKKCVECIKKNRSKTRWWGQKCTTITTNTFGDPEITFEQVHLSNIPHITKSGWEDRVIATLLNWQWKIMKCYSFNFFLLLNSYLFHNFLLVLVLSSFYLLYLLLLLLWYFISVLLFLILVWMLHKWGMTTW